MKQKKAGPEMHDLDGDGRRFAVSVDGVIRFTGSREECAKRLEILSRPSSREQQDRSLGRIFGTLLLIVAGMLTLVPRGTRAESTIDTTVPVQGQYNAAPIRQNFGNAANDVNALQRMNAGASAPSAPSLGTLWLQTPSDSTNYPLWLWDSRTSQWVWLGTLDSLNGLWVPPVGGGLPQSILADDTTDLGSYPNTVLTVTGAGPIFSFGTSAPAGVVKILTFTGATGLEENPTSMILPGGADITTSAGDAAIAVALGSGNWQILFFNSAALTVAQGGTGRATLTNHAVLLGAGTSPVNFAVPGTAGYPLLSTGASADPAFGQLSLTAGVTGTLPVGNGGTGLATVAIHGLLVGNAGSALTVLAPGTTALPLVAQGGSLDPHFAALTVPGGGTGLTTITAHGVLVGNGTSAVATSGPGTNNSPLVANGGSADPTFRPLDISTSGVTGILPTMNGGTGIFEPTAHAVLVGAAASPLSLVSPGTTGYPLLSQGASADPAFGKLDISGGNNVTGILSQTNFTLTPSFTSVTTTGNVAVGGALGVTGNVAVTGVTAFTGDVSFADTLSRDANFALALSGSNPIIVFNPTTYLSYDRGSLKFTLVIGAVSFQFDNLGNATLSGCLNYNGGTLGVCL
jgi:hypothetical protein